MARDDNVYMSALEGKSIPILTLDDKWHQLFTQTEMTPEIESLSDELNALVDRDGKMLKPHGELVLEENDKLLVYTKENISKYTREPLF